MEGQIYEKLSTETLFSHGCTVRSMHVQPFMGTYKHGENHVFIKQLCSEFGQPLTRNGSSRPLWPRTRRRGETELSIEPSWPLRSKELPIEYE